MAVQRERIKAFVKLGTFLRDFCKKHNISGEFSGIDNGWHARLDQAITKAGQSNAWFTKRNVLFALEHWGTLLSRKNLSEWLAAYPVPAGRPETVAIVMAGNVPLVGFHDLLCALVTGNSVLLKLSGNDSVLLPFLLEFMEESAPSLKGAYRFARGRLSDFDKVIATGSDNTFRYFEYYFRDRPSLIRKNRSSAAVLTGKESHDDLTALGRDIFSYFGFGCRNVSKLFVPAGYNFDAFFQAISAEGGVMDHHKYANNYDYNKAVYLMSAFRFLDNGFIILREEAGYGAPIGVLYYEHYRKASEVRHRLERDADRLQCLVGNGHWEHAIPFGQTQRPGLSEYADGVDTMDFLLGAPQN